MNHLTRNILKVVTVGLVSTSLLLTGCQNPDNAEPITRSNLKLGTLVSITIHDSQDTQLFNKLFDRLDAIEQHMSLNIKLAKSMQLMHLQELSLCKFLKTPLKLFSLVCIMATYPRGHLIAP